MNEAMKLRPNRRTSTSVRYAGEGKLETEFSELNDYSKHDYDYR